MELTISCLFFWTMLLISGLWFHRTRFSMDWGVSNLGMIQVYFIYCAHYFYYYCISSTSDIRSWRLGTPVLNNSHIGCWPLLSFISGSNDQSSGPIYSTNLLMSNFYPSGWISENEVNRITSLLPSARWKKKLYELSVYISIILSKHMFMESITHY